MSGTTAYSITPSEGVNFNQTYPLTAPVGGTGPQFPTPGMQFGMAPGKIVQGSNGVRWILGQSVAAVASGASVNLDPNSFAVSGTGTIACSPAVAVPAASLAWFQLSAPIP